MALAEQIDIITEFTQRLQVAVIGAEETTDKHEKWVEGTETETIPTANGPLKTLRGQIAEWRLSSDSSVQQVIDSYSLTFEQKMDQFDDDFVNYLLTIGFEPAVLYGPGILIERRAQTVAFNGVTHYWGGTLPYTTTGDFGTEPSWLIAPIIGGVEVPQMSFASGGNIVRKTQSVLGADGEWYYWTGTFPKLVAPGSTVESAGGVGQNKFKLSSGVVPLRPLMKIVASSAGLVLNPGSFEYGATISSETDALPHFGTGKLWRWGGVLPKVVDVGSEPLSSGGVGPSSWVEVSTSGGSNSGITISSVPPSGVAAGHRWYCTTDGRTYIRYVDNDSVQWVEESPQGSVFDGMEPRVREVLRRSYAEAGYNLVSGSFERGGTLTSGKDVLLHEETGRAYSGPSGVVVAGTNPTSGVFYAVQVEDPNIVVSVGSFANGGSASAMRTALLHSDGYNYTPKMGVITVNPGGAPDANWQCVGLLNGYDIADLRNWGDVVPGVDIMPLLKTAYSLTAEKIILPPWQHRAVLVDTFDPARNQSYPIGIRLTRQNVHIIFPKGASVKMDTVASNRYTIFDAYEAHNSSIVDPIIVGDAETHLGTDGEWGYGIRNYNSGNFAISNPDISRCWGDGILWLVKDINVYGGYILGRGVYTKCRRQGISVISCNGLYIEDSTGYDISGAINGPWATIDAEPDQPEQFIIGLEIGKVRGYKNAGPAMLVAIHQMNGTSRPVDMTIDNVAANGCQRAMEVRGDGGVSGVVKVGSLTGRDSFAQDFQTVKWSDTCQLEIETFTSINPNRDGVTSSPFGVPIGIYNNYAGNTAGGIKINRIRIINPDSNLTHPIAITNNAGGDVGTYEFGEIIYDRNRMTFPEIHNPAGAKIKTDTVIYREFTASDSLQNNRWCNGIRNTDATGTVEVTIPAGYGFDGMQLTADRTSSTSELRVTFTDLIEGYSTSIRSVAAGKLVAQKIVGTWFVDGATANNWSQGGAGRYSYGLDIGGTTANRPTAPKPWQKYFDTTLGYEVTWRQDTATWVPSNP